MKKSAKFLDDQRPSKVVWTRAKIIWKIFEKSPQTFIKHANLSLKFYRKSLKKLLRKVSCNISKWYNEIVECNQRDYKESKIIWTQYFKKNDYRWSWNIWSRKKSKSFNKFFVDIGSKLASIIPESQTKFGQYLNAHQTFIGEANFIDDELK